MIVERATRGPPQQLRHRPRGICRATVRWRKTRSLLGVRLSMQDSVTSQGLVLRSMHLDFDDFRHAGCVRVARAGAVVSPCNTGRRRGLDVPCTAPETTSAIEQ